MNEDLEQRVELMKREIDALQVTVTERSKPWYHNVSVLISIIALLFSFGTTLVSYHRNNIQEIQNARAELRGLLQRMAALPKENVEIGVKYANDPASRNLVSGFINQENTFLVRSAAELAKKLSREWGSATEYYAIAVALQAAYDIAGADQFLNYAIYADPDFNVEIHAGARWVTSNSWKDSHRQGAYSIKEHWTFFQNIRNTTRTQELAQIC